MSLWHGAVVHVVHLECERINYPFNTTLNMGDVKWALLPLSLIVYSHCCFSYMITVRLLFVFVLQQFYFMCVYVWNKFMIKELCPILNRNQFHWMCMCNTCVVKCVWHLIWHWHVNYSGQTFESSVRNRKCFVLILWEIVIKNTTLVYTRFICM